MRLHKLASGRSFLSVMFCSLIMVGCATTSPETEEQRVAYPKVTSTYPLSQPRYPDESRRRADQGLVGVEVLVGEDGRVADARIVMSSDHEALDASTLKEVFIWRFVPGRLNGKPTAMWSIYTVTFCLYDKRYPMPDQTAAVAELQKLINQRKTELATKAMAASSSLLIPGAGRRLVMARANPSLHPTFNSRLCRLSPAGELKR